MKTQKYIIFDDILGVFDVPILFPTFLQHIDIANKFGGKDNVISAGTMSFDSNGELSTYSDSLSLDIKHDINRDILDYDLILKSLTFQP